MVFDGYVLALHDANFPEACAERSQIIRGGGIARSRLDEADHRHRRLLRPRHHRPGRRAPEPRDELPPSDHSITLSARLSRAAGTVSPSALAAFMLMVRSTLADCCTGKLPGLSPLRIRPV